MKCSKCNFENPDSAKFCQECGMKLEPQHKACTNKECRDFGKYILPLEAKFCPRCGFKINFKESRYDIIESFNEGMAIVKKDNKYGYINSDGVEIIRCIYDRVEDFSEGLALVYYEGKYAFIDYKGEVVLECSNKKIIPEQGFHDGRCIVYDTDRNKYGFINKKGQLAIDCIYENTCHFHKGLALVWDIGSKYLSCDDQDCRMKFIDIEGNTKIDNVYGATNFNDDGYAIVKMFDLSSHDESGLITEIIDVEMNVLFSFPRDIFDCEASLIRDTVFKHSIIFMGVPDREQWVWQDFKNNNRRVEFWGPTRYRVYGYFENGLMLIIDHQTNLIGYINISGEIVIAPQFNSAQQFSEGLAAVSKNGMWGYIDTRGNLIIPYSYSKAGNFSECRAVVMKDKEIMVIDKKGNRIV